MKNTSMWSTNDISSDSDNDNGRTSIHVRRCRKRKYAEFENQKNIETPEKKCEQVQVDSHDASKVVDEFDSFCNLSDVKALGFEDDEVPRDHRPSDKDKTEAKKNPEFSAKDNHEDKNLVPNLPKEDEESQYLQFFTPENSDQQAVLDCKSSNCEDSFRARFFDNQLMLFKKDELMNLGLQFTTEEEQTELLRRIQKEEAPLDEAILRQFRDEVQRSQTAYKLAEDQIHSNSNLGTKKEGKRAALQTSFEVDHAASDQELELVHKAKEAKILSGDISNLDQNKRDSEDFQKPREGTNAEFPTPEALAKEQSKNSENSNQAETFNPFQAIELSLSNPFLSESQKSKIKAQERMRKSC